MNCLRPDRIEDVRAAFAAGLSIRGVFRETGITRPTLRRLINSDIVRPGRCGCGQDARHSGWCSYRYARSTARQAFIESWTPDRSGGYGRVLLRWPYEGQQDELVRIITAHAPSYWPEQIRADICQETALLLLDGSYQVGQIKEAIATARRSTYALFPCHKGAPQSIDVRRSDDDERTLAGRLMMQQPFFRLGDIVREHNNGLCPVFFDDEPVVECDSEIMEVMRADANPKWFRSLNQRAPV